MYPIFICLSSNDRRFLKNELLPFFRKYYGAASTWDFKYDNLDDDRWDSARRAIAGCRVFVFVVSNTSLISSICAQQFEEAVRLNKPILSVTHESIWQTNYDKYPAGVHDRLQHQVSTAFQFINDDGNVNIHELVRLQAVLAEHDLMPLPATQRTEGSIHFYDVFLSYAREDAGLMRRVRDTLHRNELEVWTDENLEPGTDPWQKSIEIAIENTHSLVVLMSPDAKQSRWVGNEIAYAQKQGIRIFPLLVRGDSRDAVPIGLSTSQYIDIREDYDAGLSDLIETIRRSKADVPPLSLELGDLHSGRKSIKTVADATTVVSRLRAFEQPQPAASDPHDTMPVSYLPFDSTLKHASGTRRSRLIWLALLILLLTLLGIIAILAPKPSIELPVFVLTDILLKSVTETAYFDTRVAQSVEQTQMALALTPTPESSAMDAPAHTPSAATAFSVSAESMPLVVNVQSTQTAEIVTAQFEVAATVENIYRACFTSEQEWREGDIAAIDNLGVLRLLHNPGGYTVNNLSSYDAENNARVRIRIDGDGGTRGAFCWRSGYRVYYFVEKVTQPGAIGWVRSDLLKQP